MKLSGYAISDIGTSGLDITGNVRVAGSATVSGNTITPNIGPSDTQQHALPAVASDIIVLANAAQTLSNKTLTNITLANVANTVLENVSIANSTISNTTISNTTISNTTISNTTIINPTISGALIVSNTMNSSVITSGTTITTSTTSFTGSGSGGATTITSSGVTGTIQVGQVLSGTGIASGASITAINGSTITLSLANTGTVSGTITVVGVDFLSIPSWVKRITVMLYGVSTSGGSPVQIQLGTSSGATTSGYVGNWFNAGSYNSISTGFTVASGGTGGAAAVRYAVYTFVNITGNTWAASGTSADVPSGTSSALAGAVPLAATLGRVRITTVNGTDTFDAGSINILYE
jgi:hypothetical protein